jgi:hypothetical protein
VSNYFTFLTIGSILNLLVRQEAESGEESLPLGQNGRRQSATPGNFIGHSMMPGSHVEELRWDVRSDGSEVKVDVDIMTGFTLPIVLNTRLCTSKMTRKHYIIDV